MLRLPNSLKQSNYIHDASLLLLVCERGNIFVMSVCDMVIHLDGIWVKFEYQGRWVKVKVTL